MIFVQDSTYQDIPLILNTEAKSYENAWNEKNVRDCKQLAIYLRVAYVGESHTSSIGAGHVAFQVAGNTVKMVRCAVQPKWRRMGIGTAMVNHVVDFARRMGKKRVQTVIRETADSLGPCCFLRATGFKAKGILHPEGSDEEFYIFQRIVDGSKPGQQAPAVAGS